MLATYELRLARAIRTAVSNPRPAVWLANAAYLEASPWSPRSRPQALAMAANFRRLAERASR